MLFVVTKFREKVAYMRRLDAPGRITGLDTARGVAILGMIATHIFPLMQSNPAGYIFPTWVGAGLTGVSSALFVVLAGVGLSLLTKNTTNVVTSRVQLSVRALILIMIGLLLGFAGSNVAIILVHYGVLFLAAMWFINLSRRALTITAISWIVVAPFLHGVLTRFMQLQAGGTATYVDQWRLWTSPTILDVIQQPLLTVWDILFTGYYPVISFLGYVLVGMAIGRANLKKLKTGVVLLISGTVTYLATRGLAAWFLHDEAFARRIAHATNTSLHELSAVTTTGSGINTDLVMGAPQWFGLAVPHSGAPLDIYSTAGAALAVIGLFLVITRVTLARRLLFPLTATGMVALTAYVVHVIVTGLWPTEWSQTMAVDDPLWSSAWTMLIIHWLMVAAIGVIVFLAGVRGPLESLLRNVSNGFGGKR